MVKMETVRQKHFNLLRTESMNIPVSASVLFFFLFYYFCARTILYLFSDQSLPLSVSWILSYLIRNLHLHYPFLILYLKSHSLTDSCSTEKYYMIALFKYRKEQPPLMPNSIIRTRLDCPCLESACLESYCALSTQCEFPSWENFSYL